MPAWQERKEVSKYLGLVCTALKMSASKAEEDMANLDLNKDSLVMDSSSMAPCSPGA